MTPEAQRISIAEACGWRKAERPNTPVWWKNGEWVIHDFDLPDYLNDLNAMHEAERILTPEQIDTYRVILFDGTTDPKSKIGFGENDIFSTAAQRAEAFLRTLGKWTDSPSNRPLRKFNERGELTW